mgnify:FL=1
MIFFIDEADGIKISYDDLLAKVNNRNEINQYIYTSNIEEIIVNFVASLYYGFDVVLLDSDFSVKELELLGVAEKDLTIKHVIQCHDNVKKFAEVIDKIKSNAKNVRVSIYTSGTTGIPKKFVHSLSVLLRNIKISDKHKDDIWGFAYNITHFAGIQVFLQALMNQNTIINLFNKNLNNADMLLKKYDCNCLSATPTFYRNFIFTHKEENTKVKFVTFGGEKFENDLLMKAKNKFPLAKIRNIYASTEVGSLLSGLNDSFRIPDRLKNLVKISAENHLMIHTSLLGNKNTDKDWYDTNDVVLLNADGSFKILSRDSDFINVGGYKVNPAEVESIILQVDGVLDVAVLSRKNSVLGNILVADIRKDENYLEADLKKDILAILKRELQNFKIPRIFNFVENIERSRTGKKVRK